MREEESESGKRPRRNPFPPLLSPAIFRKNNLVSGSTTLASRCLSFLRSLGLSLSPFLFLPNSLSLSLTRSCCYVDDDVLDADIVVVVVSGPQKRVNCPTIYNIKCFYVPTYIYSPPLSLLTFCQQLNLTSAQTRVAWDSRYHFVMAGWIHQWIGWRIS